MKNRNTQIIIAFIILVLVAAAIFWFFFLKAAPIITPEDDTTPSGFSPFGTSTRGTGTGKTPGQGGGTSTSSTSPVPVLRLLSNTPVGGYGASTTVNTTIIRWVDRGRGSILETTGDSLDITKLSNTLVPRIYQSQWDKSVSAFIASVIPENSTHQNTIYTEIVPQASSTSGADSGSSPFELKGKTLPDGITSYSISPKKDRVFFFSVQNGRGGGYISAITGGTLTQIFDTPVTQVTTDWPEENTIVITTKGVSNENGFMYFINPKTGVWKKIAGPIPGLSAVVSHDASHALISSQGADGTIQTDIYRVASTTLINTMVQTLADKCTWGNFYKNLVYCAVPSRSVAGSYPEDWYTGIVSFSDKIWQINATTGEVKLVSNIIGQSDRPIDGFNLSTDSKDNFLFFMNKTDLSLWSLDLVNSKSTN